MARRLLNLLTLLSLLVFLGVAGVWIPSFGSSRNLSFVWQDAVGRRTSVGLMATRGMLHASVDRWGPPYEGHSNRFEQPGVHY